MEDVTMKHFSAPWGSPLRWMSLLATVACVSAALASAFRPQWSLSAWSGILATAGPLLVLAFAAPFVIRGYTVAGSALLIHRLLWDTRVPLQGLLSIESRPGAMSKSMRTCGNGGLYSFTGWYWSRSLGSYGAYVTDLTRTVVLRFKGRTIVVSPGSPDEFVACMSPHLPATPP